MSKDKNVTEIIRQDSIEVNRGMKGEYSFHVKIYFDAEKTSTEKVVKKIKKVYKELKANFK